MSARAIFKAVVHIGDARVPVKLYSAVENRTVRFRLLHAKDHAPVRQAMVNPETDEVVPYDETRRAYVTAEGDVVTFEQDELDAIEPEATREIRLLATLPPEAIDHRRYDRPYYLGPDESEDAFAALVEALEATGDEALVRWVMRKKEYVGALRLHRGHPMLITLRHRGEVVDLGALQVPKGGDLDDKEAAMAEQLVGMLAESFDPGAYHDEYRERVLALIDAKRQGETVEAPPKRRQRRPADLARALEASLKEAGGRA